MSDVKAIPQQFASTSEPWGEIVLTNGAKIRFRTIVTRVLLVEGETDPEGNQVYGLQTQLIVAPTIPASARPN